MNIVDQLSHTNKHTNTLTTLSLKTQKYIDKNAIKIFI